MVRRAAADRPAYEPFPDVAARNGLQAVLEVPLLVRSLGLPAGGRLLELGCGRGVALPVLARLCRPALLAGVDVDGAVVAIAARRAAAAGVAAHLTQGDAQTLPFAAASFDVVVDFGTCYHVPDPAHALREVVRVLRPGGLFVHETPVSQHLAHPVRSWGRRLPWASVPELRPHRAAVLWGARRKASPPARGAGGVGSSPAAERSAAADSRTLVGGAAAPHYGSGCS